MRRQVIAASGALALAGAVVLVFLGQWIALVLWAGLWAVALVWQVRGADAAATAALVFAAAGLLATAGVRTNQQQIPVGVDVLALVFALLLLTAGLLALLWRFTIFAFGPFGADRRRSYEYLLQWMAGAPTSFQVVADGRVSELLGRPPQTASGQRTLVIKSGHAVVVLRPDKSSPVLGTGLHFLPPRESIYRVLVTNVQSAEGRLSDLMTKDGIPLKVEYSIAFRLEPQTREEGVPYAVSEDACRRAAFNSYDWIADTSSAATNLLRDKIASLKLDDLFDPQTPNTFPLGSIREDLRAQLEERARRWGVMVNAFNIHRLELPDKVREQMLTRWRVGWDAQLRLDLSRNILKVIQEHTGKASPEVALQFLETVLGGKNLEALSFSDQLPGRPEWQELQALVATEVAKMEAAQKPPARTQLPLIPPRPRP